MVLVSSICVNFVCMLLVYYCTFGTNKDNNNNNNKSTSLWYIHYSPMKFHTVQHIKFTVGSKQHRDRRRSCR